MADQRDKILRKAAIKQARRLTAIQKDTDKEIRRLLKKALEQINHDLALAPDPKSWQAFHLSSLKENVKRALETMERGASSRLGSAAGQAWQAGIDLVDKPIEAAGGARFRLDGVLGEIDTRQLRAMRSFMTDRIGDISTSVANRINSELGLVMIGAKTQHQAAEAIGALIDGGRARATTIIRTELGRAFSVASQERYEQAAKKLPGLKKQWHRSGKVHSRPQHDAIDGQVRAVDEPFTLGNGISLMFPRDPRAPAAETINCGCESVPFMDTWEQEV
ncbi:phage minor head protein [Dongia deserti]|uniref:phage minor head protein n=1 Tax=Dongia deserti TaxID=2268030 RepID=UPI000E64BD21|nr:phage minor head protein [Dongia deserti]